MIGVLWQFGYGAPWLAPEGGRGEEAGSRDLLLALGWVISSGSLLEALLAERAQGLETLSKLPGVRVPQFPHTSKAFESTPFKYITLFERDILLRIVAVCFGIERAAAIHFQGRLRHLNDALSVVL